MRQTLLTLCLSLLIFIPALAQEETPEPTVADIIGLNVPQAEALLNRLEYRLNPMLLADFAGEAQVNTVIDYEIADDNRVIVTVAREANIELVWDITDYLETAVFLGAMDGDELFTMVNLSDENIALQNIQIADFSVSAWGRFLRAGQCAQAWTFEENDGLRLPDCGGVQGGILNLMDTSQQFWRNDAQFTVTQNGVHRATCQQSVGTCRLWLSPTSIAEDIAPYIYLIYDDEQWIVYNNSASQWMDLSQIVLNDLPNLSDARNWDTVTIADLDRLAPNQCVRFARNPSQASLISCDEIAVQQVNADAIFWAETFTLTDSLNGDSTRNCPSSIGERTVCLRQR